jgi:hypothetical protein
MVDFDENHKGSETYIAYKAIENRLTDEFQTLTLEIMVENYIRREMRHRGLMSDRDFQNIKNIWRSIAEELKVLQKYPYSMESFPHAHPMTVIAVKLAKSRLGVEV